MDERVDNLRRVPFFSRGPDKTWIWLDKEWIGLGLKLRLRAGLEISRQRGDVWRGFRASKSHVDDDRYWRLR